MKGKIMCRSAGLGREKCLLPLHQKQENARNSIHGYSYSNNPSPVIHQHYHQHHHQYTTRNQNAPERRQKKDVFAFFCRSLELLLLIIGIAASLCRMFQ